MSFYLLLVVLVVTFISAHLHRGIAMREFYLLAGAYHLGYQANRVHPEDYTTSLKHAAIDDTPRWNYQSSHEHAESNTRQHPEFTYGVPKFNSFQFHG